MKAKFRKTGEIVDIITYSENTTRCLTDYVGYIDSKGIEHTEMGLNYYWDFELISESEDEHWQDVRERASIAAMQSLFVNFREDAYNSDDYQLSIIKCAVKCADLLVEELKNK